MGTFILMAATLWGGGVPVASGPTYQVEMRLVATTPAGARCVLATPVPTLTAAQGARISNHTQRIVLRRDERGHPQTWLEVRIRSAAEETQQAGPSSRGMVYPFLYEPF